MELRTYPDGAAFLSRAYAFLQRDATLNSLLIALAERTPPCTAPPYFATLHADDEVVLAVIRTPPHNVALSTADNRVLEHLSTLVDGLRREHGILPGVTGPTDVAMAFSAAWTEATSVAASVRLSFKVMELEAVRPPTWPSGELQFAMEKDVELLSAWTHRFIDETGLPEEDRPAASPEVVRERVTRRGLHLWTVDGVPVTMAAASPGSLARIGGVYTPREYRRRGYASACVARLSQSLLDGGSTKVTQSTDATNPTSNKIYEGLGYRCVGDAVLVTFDNS